MTSISVSTCNGCDRLTTRAVSQPRRPRIAAATAAGGHHILRPSLRRIADQLRATLGIRGIRARRDLPGQRASSTDSTGSGPVLLARAFGHPDGVGFIGPGADALLRGIFTEALTSNSEVAQVITTHADLSRLFGDAFSESVINAHVPLLRIMPSLEDAIEHLELEAEISKPR